MIQLRIQYSAQLRTAAGRGEEAITLDDGSSLESLVRQLAQAHGGDVAAHLLAADGSIRPSLMIARNGAAVPSTLAARTTLVDGDVILFMPPIAGG